MNQCPEGCRHEHTACYGCLHKFGPKAWRGDLGSGTKEKKWIDEPSALLRISISPKPPKAQGALQRRRELRAGGWARMLCIVHTHEYNHSKLWLYSKENHSIYKPKSKTTTQREKEFYVLVPTICKWIKLFYFHFLFESDALSSS